MTQVIIIIVLVVGRPLLGTALSHNRPSVALVGNGLLPLGALDLNQALTQVLADVLDTPEKLFRDYFSTKVYPFMLYISTIDQNTKIP